MKRISSLITGGLAGSLLLVASISAKAVNYNFDEKGNNNGNPPIVGTGVNLDPLNGGHITLYYSLLGGLTGNDMTGGDVRIWEDHVGGTLSDVLRFGAFGVGYIYVYSATDDGPLALADTGMPTAFQANVFDVVEQYNGSAYGLFGYTPTSSQPGYIAPDLNNPDDPNNIHAQPATYNFTSDEVARTPDGGSSALLLGMGVIALGALRRRFHC